MVRPAPPPRRRSGRALGAPSEQMATLVSCAEPRPSCAPCPATDTRPLGWESAAAVLPGRARPAGVSRNSLETTGFASLDLRASRDITLGPGQDPREITLGFDAFNVLNRVNYRSFVGTLSSPLFGQPVSARPARQLQFSARMKF